MIFLKILLLLSCLYFVKIAGEYVNDDTNFVDEEYEDFLSPNATNGTLQFLTELSNATKYAGDSVTFTCEIKNAEANATNAKIDVKWMLGFDTVTSNKKIKISTKKEQNRILSWIKIKYLDVNESGVYSCVFTKKPSEVIKSEAFLNVIKNQESPATPTTHFTNDIRTTFTIFNQVTEKFGSSQSSTATSTSTLPQPENQISETDANTKNEKSSTYNSSQPFCQRYTGETCHLYLGNEYVFIQPPYTQNNIEHNLREAYLVISHSNDISVECSNFVLPSLCYSAFPLCANAERIHLYQHQYLNKRISLEKQNKFFKNLRNQLTVYLQRICKGDCIVLETELCSREYAIAKRHPIIRKVLDLEECDNLPDESEKYSSSCLKLGSDGTTVDKEHHCFWGTGVEYRGVHNATVSGKKCIRWAEHFPVPLYPELLGHSYCRNPGGTENEPYCYLDQNNKEPCGLPKCSSILLTYAAVGGAFVSLIIVTSTIIYCYRRKNKTRNIQNLNIPSADKNIYGNGGPSSPIELNTLLLPPGSSKRDPNKNSFQNIANYTYNEVTLVDDLGEGAFGKVYKGKLATENGKIFVAVKSLKQNASAKTQADFQREIELISELKHPNIICLLGIVVKQEPMCMLFEYMTEGDLHEFLIANSPNNNKTLSQTQFLHIALQIALGMEYLSDNHYVHRDLAARNCLVSKDFVVKISDFGLSRDMYSCDYYRVQSKSLLPVRWMPPESILYGKFTTESDVWSYGVVLWEVYSYGLQPYYGYNNQEVINMIRSRKLLPCPEVCPSYCYSLMVECWAELAIRRPNFGEICHRLRVWKQTGNQAVGAYFKSPEVVTNPQKQGNCSKSSTLEASSMCPMVENHNDPSLTWERNLKKATAAKLSESQCSLTSRTSSLGNRNQGGCEKGSKRSIDRRSQRSFLPDGSLDRSNPRNVIVSTNGENVETKLT